MNKNSVVFEERPTFPPKREHKGASVPEVPNLHAGETVQLQVPGSHRYISVVRETVDAMSEQLRLSADDRMAVKLAVGEACNNAVDHASPSVGANGTHTPSPMTVCVKVQADALEIEITNQGNGWHPQPQSKMPDPLDFAERGRGRALMEMLMDSVEYLSVNGNTTVRMRKRLSQPVL